MPREQQPPSDVGALVEQVSRLVGRLDRLIGLMEDALLPTGAAPVSSQPASSPVEPAPGLIAARVEPAPMVKHGDAGASAGGEGASASAPLHVDLDEFGRPLPGGWVSMGEILTEVFRAALHPDEELAFLHYQRLMHSDSVAAPQALTHLRVFQWRQLRQRIGEYLTNESDPSSYSVVRRTPEHPTEADRVCKVFVKSTIREPVPTLFRRDASVGGAWRIETSSL